MFIPLHLESRWICIKTNVIPFFVIYSPMLHLWALSLTVQHVQKIMIYLCNITAIQDCNIILCHTVAWTNIKKVTTTCLFLSDMRLCLSFINFFINKSIFDCIWNPFNTANCCFLHPRNCKRVRWREEDRPRENCRNRKKQREQSDSHQM